MFAFHIILTLAGLGFATHDIVTEHNPLWMTLCATAVFPWGMTKFRKVPSKINNVRVKDCVITQPEYVTVFPNSSLATDTVKEETFGIVVS